MSALASLERFGKEDLVFISEDRAHALQNEWPLVFTCNSLAVKITGIFYEKILLQKSTVTIFNQESYR